MSSVAELIESCREKLVRVHSECHNCGGTWSYAGGMRLLHGLEFVVQQLIEVVAVRASEDERRITLHRCCSPLSVVAASVLRVGPSIVSASSGDPHASPYLREMRPGDDRDPDVAFAYTEVFIVNRFGSETLHVDETIDAIRRLLPGGKSECQCAARC